MELKETLLCSASQPIYFIFSFPEGLRKFYTVLHTLDLIHETRAEQISVQILHKSVLT